MYDFKHRAGILYHKFVYHKYGKGVRGEENSQNNEPESEANRSSTDLTYNEELEHLLFFRTCEVNRDKEVLKIRMKQTVALREKTLKKNETKFPEMFPFYFVEPDLVSAQLLLNIICL